MKNLSIKWKLIGGLSTILAMLLVVSAVSIVALQNADSELESYSVGASVAKQEVARLGLALNSGARAVRNMYIDALDDPSSISSYEALFNDQVSAAAGHIDKIRATGVVEASMLASYESAKDSWRSYEETAIAQIKAGDFEGAKATMQNQCAPSLASAATIRGTIADGIDAYDATTLSNSFQANAIATYTAAALLIIAIVFGVFLMMQLIRSILTPLSEIGASMSELSNGNLSYQNQFYSNDEFGVLCDVVRETTTDLSSYIQEIDRAMKELSIGNFDIRAEFDFAGDFKNIQTSILDFVATMNNTLEQIGTVAEQVSIGSNQVASGSQTLAQGSTEQASTVDELSVSIEKITQQIRSNSENSAAASDIAAEMGKEIQISNKQMQSTVNAMNDISDKSNEISKIVKIIDDIAFQTNILALNAAVEAARAGVAGKGFAVVADEVRNLASKSSEAANNITVLIGDSIESVTQGNDVAQKAASALEGVVKNADEVISKIDDIAGASRVQAEATEKINVGISQISSVVQSISATAEESAAASEELAGQSTSLSDLLADFNLAGSPSKNKKTKAKQNVVVQQYDDSDDDYYDNDKY